MLFTYKAQQGNYLLYYNDMYTITSQKQDMTKEKIAVIGCRKLGAPLIVRFTQVGHSVDGINIEIQKSLIPRNYKSSG